MHYVVALLKKARGERLLSKPKLTINDSIELLDLQLQLKPLAAPSRHRRGRKAR